MTEAFTVQPALEHYPAPNGSFWDERPLQPWWSWWHVPELVGVFITGVAWVTFLYGADQGVPGYDSFYHIKMAVLLPQLGLVDEFKWLTTTVFAERFVSHHWGFHAVMVPFVYAGRWLGGDYVTGAKWGIAFFFAVSMVLFHLLLMTQRVRLRWLWLGLYLVMPAQFFGRHIFIRAIAPSLACMLLILLLMFRRRYVWCALVIACYIHIYLGAVFYVPLLVGAYFLVGYVGEDGDRVSWKLPAWALAGMLVGLGTHPYREGVLDFLRIQVFGSGLTPDIPVGREWKSYEGKLWEVVFIYFGLTLSMLVVALVARLRMGDRLGAKEAAVLVINFIFLTMAFRQRRFIEYWPPFGLLTSAFLLAPLLDRMADSARALARRHGAARLWLAASAPVGLTCAGVLYLLYTQTSRLRIGAFIAEWAMWALVTGLIFLTPMSRVWRHVRRRNVGALLLCGVANLLCGALLLTFVFGQVLLAFAADEVGPARVPVPVWAWVALAVAFIILPMLGGAGAGPEKPNGRGTASLAALTTVFTGGAFVLLLILGGAGQMVELQRSSRCKFDLPALREAMAWLQANSSKDAIIFTDDWDVFPVYFYHNHHNRYIVGLDPKFSHAHDPVLWERYVKITQSKRFPVTTTVKVTDDDGQTREETIRVRLEDIRDQFGASFVMVRPDHKALARLLEAAPDLAERAHPPGRLTGKRSPPFTIFRIKPAPNAD